MRFLPDHRALVITKGGWDGSGVGTVNLLATDGSFVRTILELPVCVFAERGLLGLEIDPDFETNNLIYLFYTRQMTGCAVTAVTELGPPVAKPVWNRVSSFVFNERGIDMGTEHVLIDELPGHGGAHNGGGLAWLSDRTLLVAVGEGGYGRSHDLDFPSGKILRIDPRSPDVPPTDNQFDEPTLHFCNGRYTPKASGTRFESR